MKNYGVLHAENIIKNEHFTKITQLNEAIHTSVEPLNLNNKG